MKVIISETTAHALFWIAGGAIGARVASLAPIVGAIHGALTCMVAAIAYRTLCNNLDNKNLYHEFYIRPMPFTVISSVVAAALLHLVNYLPFTAAAAALLTGSTLIGTAVLAATVGNAVFYLN